LLASKLVNSAKWSTLGRLVNIGSEFIFGVILARVLLPSDFGIVGIISVFIVLSSVFINSGFSQALIRDQTADTKDFSTVFLFNLSLGILTYGFLFLIAPFISDFYEIATLELFLRVLSLSVILSSLAIVQQAIFMKKLDFKILNQVSMISSVISGAIAIALAYNGAGIWSLVIKTLLRDIINTSLLWIRSNWRPVLVFSKTSFRKYFKFGIYLLGSSIVGQLYSSIFVLLIGKMYSPVMLGYYNRAELFRNTLSVNIDQIVTSVTYPALAQFQHDQNAFLGLFEKTMRLSFYVVGILMVGLIFAAEPLIHLLLGEKWLPSVPILQMLCFVGIMFPLNSMNINTFNVIGRSDIYLKYQILSLGGCLLALVIGYQSSLITVLLLFNLLALLSYIGISFVFGRHFNFGFLKQLKCIKSSIFLLFFLSVVLFLTNQIPVNSDFISLILLIVAGLTTIIGSGFIFKNFEFVSIMKNVFKA
jgi:teichuronic acid exporter